MSKPYTQPGEKGTDTNQASEDEYRIFKEKRKFIVRKFEGFDHSWAEYSKPLATFETEQEAKAYIDNLTRER